MATDILIIDDDEAVQGVVARYLEILGYGVATAADGRAGIESCRRLGPGLVLCDLRMPGMDGLDVLAVLTREFPETPVIVVSGMGGLADAISALKLGAWDYVTKPIEDFEVLDHAVRKALERARLRAENRSYRENLEALNVRLERSLNQLQEDESAGRTIQFRLLPDAKMVLYGYECSREIVTSAILSGDFVDYFRIDDTHFGFYMADVSGHGVSSAFITVLLKSYMSGCVERHRQGGDHAILDPATVLAGLNRSILADRHGKYLTMFYGVINPAAARLNFGNGGQFPFPILYDGRRADTIGGKSRPIGLFDDSQFHTQTLEIPPTFSLTVFSDGVLDNMAPSDLSTKQEALRVLAQSVDVDAGSLARSLGLNQASTPLDDISVLSIRRLAQ